MFLLLAKERQVVAVSCVGDIPHGSLIVVTKCAFRWSTFNFSHALVGSGQPIAILTSEASMQILVSESVRCPGPGS